MQRTRAAAAFAVHTRRHERRHGLPSADRGPEPQDAVAGVVRLLRVVGLCRLPRHRIQRHPRGRRAHRRVAAVQVPGARERCNTARRPRDHPRCDAHDPGRRLLHAVVRRARQGDRRRDRPPARRWQLPLDRGRPAAPLAAPQRRRARCRHRRGDRGCCSARPPGPAVAGRPRRRDRGVVRRPALLPPPPDHVPGRPHEDPRRRVADRLHGRPRLRAVDPGRARCRGVGRSHGGGGGVRHPARRHARPRRRRGSRRG